MNRNKLARQACLSFIALLTGLLPCAARAQAYPVAVQPMQLSTFGGVSGDYTGLAGGKNLSVTAGVDLGFPPVRHVIHPVFEVRGTFPMDKGSIVGQRSALGGGRLDFLLGRRFHPYGDFLFGRGQMNYVGNGGKGYYFHNFDYVLTTSYVYGPGVGIDLPFTPHVRVKIDGQYQHWSSAPVDSGTIWSKTGTIGLVYLFDFNRHGIH